MWLTFENCEFHTDLESKKTGNKYSAFVVDGIKKGYQEEPDSPYSKIFFEGNFVKVKQGDDEYNMLLNEFFAACEPGDLVIAKLKKGGTEVWNWVFSEVENKNRVIVQTPPLEKLEDTE